MRKVLAPYEIYYIQLSEPDCGERPEEWLADGGLLMLKQEMQKGVERVAAQEGTEGGQVWLVPGRCFGSWLDRAGAREYFLKLWDLPLYADYRQERNVRFLLERIPGKERFAECIIAGYDRCIEGELDYLARHFRALRFLFLDPPGSFVEQRELLYEEYGLMAAVEEFVLEDRESTERHLRRIRLKGEQPCMIIDLTGEKSLPVCGMCHGSLWLDVDAAEGRRHMFEDRPTGIEYISLPKIWEREMAETLDTISKFEYNT